MLVENSFLSITGPTLAACASLLGNPATSCPVERLFSVAGQVDDGRRESQSPDTLTLLVFMHESLPLVRKIRADRRVETQISTSL